MLQFIQGLPLLLMAAVLLIVSAAEPDSKVTSATLAAGLVVLGAWTAVEVVRLLSTEEKEDPPSESTQ
jgi:hypothetical protein